MSTLRSSAAQRMSTLSFARSGELGQGGGRDTLSYLRQKLQLKDRFVFFKKYRQCFTGFDAVDAIVKFHGCSREEAVALGSKLLTQRLILHVNDNHLFEDKKKVFFYFAPPSAKLSDKADSASSLGLSRLRLGNLNSGPGWRGMRSAGGGATASAAMQSSGGHGNATATRHLKRPSLNTQVGGYSGTMHMRASSNSSTGDADATEAASTSVMEALRTARVHLALSGKSDYITPSPSNDNASPSASLEAAAGGASADSADDTGGSIQSKDENEFLQRLHRDQIFQGEQLAVVVQLDVSADFHPAVLRPLRELDCQIYLVDDSSAVRRLSNVISYDGSRRAFPVDYDPTQSRFVTTAVPHIPDSDDEDDALEEVQTLSLDQVATAALEVSSEPAPAPAPVPIEQLTGSARFKAMQAAHEAKEKAKEKAKRDAARAEAHRNRELLVASSYEPRHAVVFRASVHVHVDEWDLGKPLNFIAVLASTDKFQYLIANSQVSDDNSTVGPATPRSQRDTNSGFMAKQRSNYDIFEIGRQLQEHSDCGASMLHAVQHDGDGVDLAADGGTTSASSTVPNSRRGSTFSMAAVSSAAGANLAAAMAGGVAGQGDVSSSASNSSTQGNPVIAALIKSPPRSRGGSEISHPKLDRIPSMKRASSPSAGKSSNSGGSGQTSGSHDAGDTDGSHSMINLLIPRIHKPKAIRRKPFARRTRPDTGGPSGADSGTVSNTGGASSSSHGGMLSRPSFIRRGSASSLSSALPSAVSSPWPSSPFDAGVRSPSSPSLARALSLRRMSSASSLGAHSASSRRSVNAAYALLEAVHEDLLSRSEEWGRATRHAIRLQSSGLSSNAVGSGGGGLGTSAAGGGGNSSSGVGPGAGGSGLSGGGTGSTGGASSSNDAADFGAPAIAFQNVCVLQPLSVTTVGCLLGETIVLSLTIENETDFDVTINNTQLLWKRQVHPLGLTSQAAGRVVGHSAARDAQRHMSLIPCVFSTEFGSQGAAPVSGFSVRGARRHIWPLQVPAGCRVGVEARLFRPSAYVLEKGEKAADFVCDNAEFVLEWTAAPMCSPVQVFFPCREVPRSQLRGAAGAGDSIANVAGQNDQGIQVELSFEFSPRVSYREPFSVTCFAKNCSSAVGVVDAVLQIENQDPAGLGTGVVCNSPQVRIGNIAACESVSCCFQCVALQVGFQQLPRVKLVAKAHSVANCDGVDDQVTLASARGVELFVH